MTSPTKSPAGLERVSIIGIGLLGGSVGMSLRRNGVRVFGYSRKQATCDLAMALGAVDEASTDLRAVSQNADVIVIASPVNKIAELTKAVLSVTNANALITDVGSTKSLLVSEVSAMVPDQASRFVGAHPIAGSEKTGVGNASATLLDGKPVIVTPTSHTEQESLDRICDFWRLTGSVVMTMPPDEHDDRLAAVSHVPHLVSSLLASSIDEHTAPLVGSGWKDMTRVASGDPGMWTAICEHNRDAIVGQLNQLQQELSKLQTRVADLDSTGLLEWLEQAKRKKDGV